MIYSVRLNNFLVYSNEAELSLRADMRIKKFANNVWKWNHFHVLKSACLYGANNSGKTCFIRAIQSMRNIILGQPAMIQPNLFSNSNECSLGISFIEKKRAFSYDVRFDLSAVNGYRRGFVYECLKEIFIDKYGNTSEKICFLRDVENNTYCFSDDDELSQVLSLVSNDNILIYTINTLKYPKIDEYKQILRSFASRIDVLDMNNIPIEKTIRVLKNNEKIKKMTVELIKLSDLDIEDYQYLKNDSGSDKTTNHETFPQESILKNTISVEDMYRLTSVHKGKRVQSLFFDSTGTKKMVAISSYIIDALTNGRILILDELDSSLHFKLTRAIVSLFHNELNTDAQMIFSAHDITLLDCKKLFRKDQIWFTSRDSQNEYLYSLAEFTAEDNHIRSESDLFEKYNSGVLGAIPEPDLISVLLFDSKKGDNK